MKISIRYLSASAVMAMAMGTQSGWAQATDTATADATVTVVTPLTVIKVSDLNFGTVVRPQTGDDVYATMGVDGTRTGNATYLGGGANAATFTVSGEGVMAYTPTVTLAYSDNANSGAEMGGFSAQCDSADEATSVGFVALEACALATGTSTVKVGGDLVVSPASAGPFTNGAVSLGTITVVVAYN